MSTLYAYCRLIAVLCTTSFVIAQGTVFVVSTAGPITDVQTAINMAGDGDLIEVAPGTYPPFTVSGKQLSIVGIDPNTSSPATFAVTAPANTPAITIDGLASDQLVTLSGARVNHANQTAPAIVIANNPLGNVRLLDVIVTTTTALGTVPYDGVLEIASTNGVWLDRVRIGDHRIPANGSSGTGVCGLFCDDSQLLLTACDLRGMRSASANAPGGDGLRTVGAASTVWMVDTNLLGGMSSAGAVPFTLGGHALHDFSGNAGLLKACDCTLATTVSSVAPVAIAGAPALLSACTTETIGRTALSPFTTTLRRGAATTIEISANVGNRVFILVISDSFGHQQLPGLFTGVLVFGANIATLTVGVIGATPTQVPLNVPNVPAAIGLVATLQSVLLDPVSTSVWSMSTPAGFTIR